VTKHVRHVHASLFHVNIREKLSMYIKIISYKRTGVVLVHIYFKNLARDGLNLITCSL
jgi:hypothetical protein